MTAAFSFRPSNISVPLNKGPPVFKDFRYILTIVAGDTYVYTLSDITDPDDDIFTIKLDKQSALMFANYNESLK